MDMGLLNGVTLSRIRSLESKPSSRVITSKKRGHTPLVLNHQGDHEPVPLLWVHIDQRLRLLRDQQVAALRPCQA